MPYKTYTPQDLADLTGRPVASFREPYTSASAIPQALLLFKMGTCLASPDDLTDDQKQLVDFAIVFMADAIGLASLYATVHANPFNSESIGSYSYSKAAQAVANREPTGVMWFDRAIEELSICDTSDGLAMTGGIEVFERTGGFFGPGHIGANVQFLTPADIDASRTFGWDPSPGHYIVQEG